MSEQMKSVGHYDEFRANIAEIKEYSDFLPDVSNTEGYTKSKRVALDVGKILTAVEKKRKELKADSIATGKAIDGEAKTIAAELECFQLPHKQAYKELDDLKKEREQRRKENLQRRVDDMRSTPGLMRDMDSDAVACALADLKAEECLDFYEFTAQALNARNDSQKQLSEMYAVKLKSEQQAVELAELREKQAAQDQKDHDERIAREASEQAEAQADAARQAEQKAIEQAAEAVKQREAVEKQSLIDAEQAKQREVEAASQSKIDAEKAAAKAKINAENATKKALADERERQRIEQEKAAFEVAKREANTKHIGKIRCEAKESIMSLGIAEDVAKKLVLAIHNKKIKNVSISY
jgi:hypothetical protein